MGVGLVVAAPVQAAPAPEAPTQASSTDKSKRLDRAALQGAVQAMVDAGAVGVTAHVSGPNGTWDSAAGVAQRYPRQPALRGDRTRVASITKSMVSTVAMQEVEAGRWSLQTTIDDVLPGAVPGHGDVTLDQLLSHRSGMPDYLLALVEGPELSDLLDGVSRAYTDPQLLAITNSLPWTAEPGTAYTYSNSNYLVVGMMLQAATGRTMGDLLTERVFEPAGMSKTTFGMSPTIRGRHLTEYLRYDRLRSLASFNPTSFSSAGAVVSTMADLDRFYDALMSGRLLEPDLVDAMIVPRSTEVNPYGLGLYQIEDACLDPQGQPQTMIGHDGATYGTLSVAFTSRDGSRQMSMSWTGRDLTAAPPELPVNGFLLAAMAQTCQGEVATGPMTTQQGVEQGIEPKGAQQKAPAPGPRFTPVDRLAPSLLGG